ncbi:MAG: response regulator transcription factor [Chitinophagaceae bacterium]|nr:response regulator transcription factor [Chitinophagaceae bacterium]
MLSDTNIKCVIVDDEPLPLELLGDYISRTPGLSLVASIRNPLEALPVIEQGSIQILFLDIEMPELMGLHLAKLIQGKCEIVITTAYPQYAVNGYEHDVADYLLKPFGFERFLAAINKCKKRISTTKKESSSESTHFYVKTGNRLLKMFHNDVIYLEGMRDYVGIHTHSEKVLTLQSLSSFEEQLPDHFVRIHRSFIINADKISFIEGNIIGIGSATLPIGEKYQNRITRLL